MEQDKYKNLDILRGRDYAKHGWWICIILLIFIIYSVYTNEYELTELDLFLSAGTIVGIMQVVYFWTGWRVLQGISSIGGIVFIINSTDEYNPQLSLCYLSIFILPLLLFSTIKRNKLINKINRLTIKN